MEGSRLFLSIFNACRWICYFFYLNIMWIACTLLGIVVFGIFPSTVALYTIARRSLMGEEDIPVFREFWRVYRQEFKKSNLYGSIFVIIGIIWWLDMMFVQQIEGFLSSALTYLLLVIGVLFVMFLLYIFPLYVHYDMKLSNYVKYAIAFGFLHPINLIAMVITVICMVALFLYFQGLIPLFGISILVHLNMGLAFQSFKKMAEKQERYQQKSHYPNASV